jgi:cytochrome o ubiquinol oxidase operon protein cyoD
MAVVQVLVHVYLLPAPELVDRGALERVAFTFTIIITLIVVAGSVWIMYHATTNMEHHMMGSDAVMPQR